MSDYTLAVSWSGKDGLSDSDAGKVISGSDFNSEFTTIRTAVNSKADIASETLTGTPLAPTAAAGTDTTQIATTAFVTAAVAAHVVYPIGAVFTTITAYANSAAVVAVLGGTTWAAFGAGKVLVGLDSGDASFDTVEETGGAKTDAHTLATSETPAHTHTYNAPSGSFTAAPGNPAYGGTTVPTTAGTTSTASGSAGGGGAHTHDIVQPYIVVYFWKRTA